MTEHTLAKELRERAPPSDNALFGYCGDLMRRAATALERLSVGERELWPWNVICGAAVNRARQTNHKAANNLAPAMRAIIMAGLQAGDVAPAVPVVDDAMVERAAQKLYETGRPDYDPKWDRLHESIKAGFRKQTKAALSAALAGEVG